MAAAIALEVPEEAADVPMPPRLQAVLADRQRSGAAVRPTRQVARNPREASCCLELVRAVGVPTDGAAAPACPVALLRGEPSTLLGRAAVRGVEHWLPST